MRKQIIFNAPRSSLYVYSLTKYDYDIFIYFIFLYLRLYIFPKSLIPLTDHSFLTSYFYQVSLTYLIGTFFHLFVS